jgi:hypothetical protein
MDEGTSCEVLHMDGDSSQILQMVRLGTDENGETIIFVQPEDKNEAILSYQTQEDDCLKDMSQEEEMISEEGSSSKVVVNLCNKMEDEEMMTDDEMSSDDEDIPRRRCVVCLRRARFTEDIFDSSKQLLYNIDVLIAHLNIEVLYFGS